MRMYFGRRGESRWSEVLSRFFPISTRHDAAVAFSLLGIKAGCNYVLNKCSKRNKSDRSRGDICQTIVKKTRVVAVNKAAANKEAAARVAKRAGAAAASKAATAELTGK